jgi:hypothetical protein
MKMKQQTTPCAPCRTASGRPPATVSAQCVAYANSRLPEWSNLSGSERCDTVSDALDELYRKAAQLLDITDMSQLQSRCLDFVPLSDELTAAQAVNTLARKLCSLFSRIRQLEGAFAPGTCMQKTPAAIPDL